MLFTETADVVEIIYIERTKADSAEAGAWFMHDAMAYCDQTGKRLVAVAATAPEFYARLGMDPEPQPDGSLSFVYDPAERPSEATTAATTPGTCPTCGDRLQGAHETFCPRCQWSEHNVNIDHDPLSNPPDPTVDMHRGIQAHTIPSHRWAKWFAAVEDLGTAQTSA